MFTTSRRRNSSRWKFQKRKNRRPPKLRTIALASLGAIVGLEVLARAIAAFTGAGQQLTSNPAIERLQSYQLKFVNAQKQPYSALPSDGKLLAMRDPLLGYHLVPQQKSSFWTINAQGFRDPEPVPLDKPKNEVRIFILGGSTAFGQLSSDRAVFSQQLEQLLNAQVAAQRSNPNQFQPEILPFTLDEVNKVLKRPVRIPDRVYRVINAAVPGYASGNDLALLTQEVANYNPDIVIALNSYADLLLPAAASAADIPGLENVLSGKPVTPVQTASLMENWFSNLYLVKFLQSFSAQAEQQQQQHAITLNVMATDPTQPIDQQLAADPTELNRRIDRYRDNLVQMLRWSNTTKKRLIVGLQPEITGRQQKNQMTPAELAIVQELGENYVNRMRSAHAKLKATANATVKSTVKSTVKPSANVKLLDLYSFYDQFPEQAFQSPVSLTDVANKRLAQRLSESVIQQIAIEPKPYEAGLRR